MAQDDNNKEDKFDFSSEGEALRYISLDQAVVLAMRTARETPGPYGTSYQDVPMVFDVVENNDTEDHYVITLSFRPQGQFEGTPGMEQFSIEKEGTVAHRQVRSLHLIAERRRFPLLPVALGLVVVAITAIVGVVIIIAGIGSGTTGQPEVVALVPNSTPLLSIETSDVSTNKGQFSRVAPVLTPSDTASLLFINKIAVVAPTPTSTPTLVPRVVTSDKPNVRPTSESLANARSTPIRTPTPFVTHNVLQNTKIAFLSGNDIYVMNAVGSSRIRLTNDGSVKTSPAWSPDGRWIAFSSNLDGDNEIYVMNTDGSEKTRLTNNEVGDQSAAWSPTSRRIAFVSRRDGNSEIYVMDSDGTGQIRLTNSPGGNLSPAWSPDGLHIAFATLRDGNREIYVMNADGSAQTRLTNNDAFDDRPSWSSDGRRIAFNSKRNGHREIYVMNTDGSDETLLTTNDNFIYEGTPSWSPDGRFIAFTSYRNQKNQIYVMNADGSAQSRITKSLTSEWAPAWSPILPPG